MSKRPDGYSMPLGSPAYGPPPYYGGEGIKPSELLLTEFECEDGVLEGETPEPLEAIDNRAVLWLGDATLGPANYGVYHEGAVIFRARYGDTVGGTIPYIWTDSGEAMLVGREIYGFAKMLCDTTPLEYVGPNVNGEIVRRGQPLLRAGLTLEAKASPQTLPQVGPTFFFIKLIPSAEEGGKPLRQLIRIDQSFEVLECWSGRSFVDFAAGAQFVLKEFQPKKMLGSFFVKAKWLLPYGKIVAEF